MRVKPKHNITAEKAFELVKANEPIKNVFVSGKLNFTGIDNFDKAIVIENCIVEYLEGISSQYLRQVKLINSEFELCDFTFTYFIGGLEIENCCFKNYLDFQAGGHNRGNNSFSIRNSTFKKFVNFFDCWFESEVIIVNNDFQKGTNLLGKHTSNSIKTVFDIVPLIENNIGKLDINSEGDYEDKSIYLKWKE
jgi:hypothetical protein